MRNTKAKAIRKKAEDVSVGRSESVTRKVYKAMKSAYKRHEKEFVYGNYKDGREAKVSLWPLTRKKDERQAQTN